MISTMRPCFLYQGAKWKMAPWILAHLPPHQCYVEPFVGSGAVYFAKKPSTVEVLNDIDRFILCVFRAIRGHHEEMQALLHTWPKSRVLFWRFRDELNEMAANGGCPDESVEVAAKWFYTHWNSFGGKGQVYGTSSVRTNRSPGVHTTEQLGMFADRLQYTDLECGDFAEVIERYDSPETLMYVDPPYYATDGDGYRGSSFTDADHLRLAEMLRAVRGKVVLSGFADPRVGALYPGWRTATHARFMDITNSKNTDGRRSVVTECLWMNGDWATQPTFFDAVIGHDNSDEKEFDDDPLL